MPDWTNQDISRFQKLYLKHYGEKLTKEEASIRITALVGLLALSIEVENSLKNSPNNPNGSLSELK